MSRIIKLVGLAIVFIFLMVGNDIGTPHGISISYGGGSSSWLGVLVLLMLVKFAGDNR